MEIKKDCFAYDCQKNKCKALKKLYCKTEKCNFYKSKYEFNWEKIEK